ncbi:hypothetical protein GCM10009718_26070 [Isoptericola halotolerans]
MTHAVIARSEPDPPGGNNGTARWFDGVVSTTTEETTEPLTAADRCDRCGAQAYVRVVLPVGELLFCGHHARAHADAYQSVAQHVQDETDRLHAEHGAR